MKLTRDNPILTAYALGELDPAEAAEVRTAIGSDESLLAEVEAICAQAGELEAQLTAEPMGRLSNLQRAALVQRAEEIDRATIGSYSPDRQRWLGVAAAAVLLLLAGVMGIWALLPSSGPTGPVVASVVPAPAPTPSPLGPTPMSTPTQVDDRGFFDPWHASVGSATLRPDGTQAEPGQSESFNDNPFCPAAELPGSTFGLNVDDASYRHIHHLIFEESRLPEPSSVRIEEMINHFSYNYTPPATDQTKPLTVRTDLAQCPWAKDRVLLRVVVQARPGQADQWAAPPEIIAKDARVRVVFNPAAVAKWRLIGFDGPLSGPDAGLGGLIAAGRSLTVLYELAPADNAKSASACTVRAEYRLPGEARLRKLALRAPGGAARRFEDASEDFRFAATVAGFGMILRNSPYKGTCTAAGMLDAAEASLGDDPMGRRSEFVGVLREACMLPLAE